jgi:hypothetical protein
MSKETIAFVILSIYVSTCSAVCVTQPLIVGEITDAYKNDPGVIAAAAYANNLLWEDLDIRKSEYVLYSAEYQIVNGIKYYLDIQYPEDLFCSFEVIYQSWINQYSAAFQGCRYQERPGETTTRPIRTVTLAGVITDADINDPGVIAAAAFVTMFNGKIFRH